MPHWWGEKERSKQKLEGILGNWNRKPSITAGLLLRMLPMAIRFHTDSLGAQIVVIIESLGLEWAAGCDRKSEWRSVFLHLLSKQSVWRKLVGCSCCQVNAISREETKKVLIFKAVKTDVKLVTLHFKSVHKLQRNFNSFLFHFLSYSHRSPSKSTFSQSSA